MMKNNNNCSIENMYIFFFSLQERWSHHRFTEMGSATHVT